MITTSAEFKSAVYGITRQTKSKIVFDILDTTAMSDAEATTSAECPISQITQMFNEVRETSAKYATLEEDFWKLDGTFLVPPTVAEASGYEVGWWSQDICASNGYFETPQEVQIDFDSTHDSIGLTITFDSVADDYAEEFNIDVYDSVGALIHNEIVTNNDSAKYILEQNLPDYKQIVITVYKWANGNRRARIIEIDFGIIEEYTVVDLIKMSILEEVDPLSANLASNELKFTLDNTDRRFNLLNPEGIYSYLQRRQKLVSSIGVVKENGATEYIPTGTFYLTEWASDEGSMTASFTAHDILDFLEQSTYRRGKVQNATLTALATDILDDAGITDYNIDTALTSITVGGNIPICSHREALQYVAVAGQAVVYVDRDNVVQIKQLDTVAEDDFIDFDNVYDKPKIVLDKLVNTVEVPVSNYTLRGASEEVFNGVIYVNGTENIWIEYESAPCASVTALASGGTLNSATYYGNGALLNLTGTGNITVTATGKVYDVSNTPYSLLDGTAPAGEATLQLKVSNPLLTSISLASDVAQWILDEKKKRFIYEINWRGNPAHECCDIIPVEDIYGQNLDVRLTKNELSFDGTLRAKTSGRGA